MTELERDESDIPELSTLSTLSPPDGWPIIDRAAFHGPIGRFAEACEPYTEADPVAILYQLLAWVGVIAGRNRYIVAGNDRHAPALFVVLVGASAKAGKGTSYAVVREAVNNLPFSLLPPEIRGLGSGEVLIDAIRDPTDDDDDDAPGDQRALLVETEFARALRAIRREGSTLGQTLREGWDQSVLESRSRGAGRVRATGYHLGLAAHVTSEELQRNLTDTEIFGGTANRILWPVVRRNRLLPSGGNVPEHLLLNAATEIAENLAKLPNEIEMVRTEAAEKRWCDLYFEMAADDPPGLIGALTARAAPQMLRISLAFALADGCTHIDVDHIDAAWAVWQYSRKSVDYVFGDASGDKNADRLLAELSVLPEGIRRELVNKTIFSNHLPKKDLDRMLQTLERSRQITVERISTGGRPKEVLRHAMYAR